MTEEERVQPDTEETKAQLAATSKPAAGAGKSRRTRTFRRSLLSKLPKLTAAGWEASDTLNVFDDIQGIVQLDSDTFLEPLETLAEARHG
jgi:hypothetical protein